jgi:hypothetical protein
MERGQLKAFVIENVNLSAESIRAEARRLLPLAAKSKLKTTLNAMDQTVRGVLRAAGRPPAGADDGPELPEEEHGNGHNGNGASAPTARVVSSQAYLRKLADTREMLTTLASQVHATAELVASLEAEEIARATRLEQMAEEWLGSRTSTPLE